MGRGTPVLWLRGALLMPEPELCTQSGKDGRGILLTALKSAVKASILARSVPAGRAVKGPVVVAGMFRTASGLGSSAWNCLEGLRDSGIDAFPVDLSDAFNQVDQHADRRLVPMPLGPTGTLILHVNWQETVPALMFLGLRCWHRWRIIGYWAWELEVEPVGASSAASYLSEIWTCSKFCVGAFDGLSVPVHCVPHRVAPTPTVSALLPLKTCLVMADGRSSLERKNVFSAIEIFSRALGDNPDWQLVLKCRNLDLYEEYASALRRRLEGLARAKLITASLPAADVQRLIAGCDILLSAHRSEGFGLHLAEAMALGKCVVATGWSGNLEFMTANNSVLLPYTLRNVIDKTGVYAAYPDARWAEVDVETSARLLAEVAYDAPKRQRIGARAASDIARGFGGSIYAQTLGIKSANFPT